MIARLAHDLSVRVVYPFVPEIAAGLRIRIDQLGTLLSVRSGAGIVSPLFGIMADRIGHRRAMSTALAVLAVGSGLIGMADGLAMGLMGFGLTGLGSAMYLPALLAYLSERTPYARRGRVLGAVEMTWAAASIVGIPLMGVLIGSQGWRAPFIGLAGAMLACAALTLNLPETPTALRAQIEPIRVGAIFGNRSAMAFLVVWLTVFIAFENIQVGYARWFESRFGLTTGERANVQSLFGLFEIAASAGSSLLLDRMGKKRGVTSGLIVALSGYALLAGIGPMALPLGLAAMSVAFLGFEFSVVSGLSIGSEQMPKARGTMLALGVMAGGLGRMIGAVTGSALSAGPGFTAAALVSALVAIGSVSLFAAGVRESGQA